MADSQAIVKALHEVDPGFAAICETLFGKAVDAHAAWDYLYGRDGVAKMTGPDMSTVHAPAALTKPGKGVLVPKPAQVPNVKVPRPPTMAKAPAASGVLRKAVGLEELRKELLTEEDYDGLEIVWSGEFSKYDVAKRQAFGWASVVEIDGKPVVDLQGDFITPEDLEDAAYSYVTKSRIGGTQHARDELDRPIQAGHLIESVVFTDEKVEKMGLPADFPRGWWTGFQYEPGRTWDDIEKGLKTGFSVHGRGKRVPVTL